MDALEILREMHVEAKGAFGKIQDADVGERGGLWAKLRPELVMHEQLEERFVYDPMSHDVGHSDPTLSGWHDRHHHEVEEAESMIHRIGEMDSHEDRWLTTVMELKTALEGHIHTEENEIWPRIRTMWGTDKLEDVGGKLNAAKTVGGAGAAMAGAVGQAGEALNEATRHVTEHGRREEPAA